MDPARTVMPDEAEFVRRLQLMSVDGHEAAHFHPLLFPLAGKRISGRGMCMALAFALREYGRMVPAFTISNMWLALDRYVYALVDDPVVQQDALSAIGEMI